MTAAAAWFGVLGMAVFVPVIWYSLRVVDNFEAQEDLSMYRLFDSDRGVRAFRWLTAAFGIYALTLLVSGYGEMVDLSLSVTLGVTSGGAGPTLGLIANLDRLGALVAFTGLAFFLRTVTILTREDVDAGADEDGEQDEN